MKWAVYREDPKYDYEIITPPDENGESQVIASVHKSLGYDQACEVAAAPEMAMALWKVYQALIFPEKYQLPELAKTIKEALVKANKLK
jgi:hypothetical protein